MPIKEPKKAFIWYALRISFYIMIGIWIVASILNLDYTTSLELIFGFLFVTITIFTFVISIIHLTKYKNKAFAVVSLVISSIVLVLFLYGVLMAFISPINTSGIIFDEKNNFVSLGNYDSLSFGLYDYSYINLDFNSNAPVNFYLLNENENLRYEAGEPFYYVESSEKTKFISLENQFLSPDNYYIIIESIDNPVTYDIFVNSTISS